MHPRIQELVDYVDAQRIVLRRAFEAVPPGLRDVPPAPGQWSPGGIVEHLAIVSGRVTKLVAVRVADARAAGVGPETRTDPLLPTLNIERVLDRSIRVAAPAMLHPTGIDADAAWAALEHATIAFRGAVTNADALALGGILHPHPFLGPLSLYQWIAFVGAHEARHAAQIVEQTMATA
ncbi:MAG: hypothetical protein DMF98_06170 [Acidobacteria bacterium]|nr:MAG: hypothetical protein DMF98_06170 [Acidobacteriota bacterium]